MIAVFAYAFPHRKSHDFLVELALMGQREVTVIGAPFQKLPSMDRTVYFPHTLRAVPPLDTKELCERLGFSFVEMPHSDIDGIINLVDEHGLELGIISGARILKRPVIEAFKQGIVNFHPGKIPETSGLDAFFYTLKNGVDAGVTTHLIDPRVDAGQHLAFDATQISATDTPEIVQENTYRLQITALRQFLDCWTKSELSPTALHRPTKNEPMAPSKKWETLLNFPAWRATRVRMQAFESMKVACNQGDVQAVSKILEIHPDLLEERTEKGWTPLIMAAFNQRLELTNYLLEHRANPNATGRNGTTVLMYAKTALMAHPNASFELLDTLLASGADPLRTDMHGRALMDYVKDAKAEHLERYFQEKIGRH
ncbi:ankyrin repeat domain-containing protein (plasmid) [Ruegeria sp. SCSIO 43209]|uniref:formyltransferase family protein n=1 Tax=Ruegeria sp. SCSIO 43209 TaxID=2793010 RepID=UPI00147B219A|nr:formyltransferase family protein [Ruegeria sp. SCSIO 43209]UAB91609.1 ankyrin repeat domain-containing protein [Ruegeria sp. SCSIO 43209]